MGVILEDLAKDDRRVVCNWWKRNYSATESWLREFAGFCHECGGFRVS